MTENSKKRHLPTVTVVVPTYNRAAVISSTVDSVIAQTFVDWELIIVDDCSKDVEVLSDYVASLKSDKVTLIKHESNRHGSAARNTGINAAKGSIIALLDSDDVWEPDHLASLLPLLENEKDVVYSRVKTALGVQPERGLQENELVCDYLLSNKGIMQTSSLVLHTTFAQQVLFDEPLVRFQDLDFAIRLQNESAQFKYYPHCTVLMTDADAGGRISNQVNVKPAIFWLERIGGLLSEKAAVAFYVKRVARLHVISLNQGRIFKDMPERVYTSLSLALKLRLFLYSIAPNWFISLTRAIVKKKKTLFPS